MPLIILKWKNRLGKCAEFVQNSRKWFAEFAIFLRRIMTTLTSSVEELKTCVIINACVVSGFSQLCLIQQKNKHKAVGLCCTAHAKLMMHDEVTVQDAVCAVSLMESSMQVRAPALTCSMCVNVYNSR